MKNISGLDMVAIFFIAGSFILLILGIEKEFAKIILTTMSTLVLKDKFDKFGMKK